MTKNSNKVCNEDEKNPNSALHYQQSLKYCPNDIVLKYDPTAVSPELLNGIIDDILTYDEWSNLPPIGFNSDIGVIFFWDEVYAESQYNKLANALASFGVETERVPNTERLTDDRDFYIQETLRRLKTLSGIRK